MSNLTLQEPLTLFDDEPYRPQIVMAGDSPRVRKDAPLTSHAAADSITVDGRKGSQAFVLNDLCMNGRSGAWQVEERAELGRSNWSPSRIRTAIKELEELGQISRVSGSGVTPRGRKCDQFEAVTS